MLKGLKILYCHVVFFHLETFDRFVISLVWDIKGSRCCYPLPEWGRCKISNGHWLPDLIHRTSRENQTACFVIEIWESMSIWNFTSASFWKRVTTTAPFQGLIIASFIPHENLWLPYMYKVARVITNTRILLPYLRRAISQKRKPVSWYPKLAYTYLILPLYLSFSNISIQV